MARKVAVEDRKVTSPIKIENARLIFRNFQGKKTDYNDEGNRNFGVLLPDDLAEQLEADGWNVKRLKPRDDAEDPTYEQPWLPVKVKFGQIPPICEMITGRGRTKIYEDTIDQFDWANIKQCDLIIRPYNYPAIQGRPAGVSAYLKSIYVTIQEDDLAEKYADIPYADDDEYDE